MVEQDKVVSAYNLCGIAGETVEPMFIIVPEFFDDDDDNEGVRAVMKKTLSFSSQRKLQGRGEASVSRYAFCLPATLGCASARTLMTQLGKHWIK